MLIFRLCAHFLIWGEKPNTSMLTESGVFQLFHIRYIDSTCFDEKSINSFGKALIYSTDFL